MTVHHLRAAAEQIRRTADWIEQSASALTAEQAREDGHTGACDATEPTSGPEPDKTRNGRQTGVQDLEQWSAIINNEVDPDYAAGKLLALRDTGQRQLRAELDQTRAALEDALNRVENQMGAADELITEQRRLEEELVQARSIVDRVTAVAKNYPGLTALRNALDDHATPGEVLPDELLRLLDMNRYVSTACDTAGACETAAGNHAGDADKLTERAAQLHARCRRTHKFTGQPCGCGCHHKTAGDGERPPC